MITHTVVLLSVYSTLQQSSQPAMAPCSHYFHYCVLLTFSFFSSIRLLSFVSIYGHNYTYWLLKTKLVLSGRDLDTPVSALVQLSNYLSLSLQWPCSLLPFPWWNDFPTVDGWGWVITSHPLQLKNLHLSHIFVSAQWPSFIKPPKLHCFTDDILYHQKTVTKKV